MKFIPSLAAVSLPRGAAGPFPLPGSGDLPADIVCMRDVGRAFPTRGGQSLLGVALEEMHEGRVGGDEFGRGSVGHVTLHAGDRATLNRGRAAVMRQAAASLTHEAATC